MGRWRLDPEVAEFLDLYPPLVWIMRARCPLCREWGFVDVLERESICRRGHRHTLAELNAWKRTHPSGVPQPATLYQYYPSGVVPCPSCGAALELDDARQQGSCGCGGDWPYSHLIDRRAQAIMEEPPRRR